jgi:hypothetical protein
MKHIAVVQSFHTGRFLLTEREGVWEWPRVADIDENSAMLFDSMNLITDITGIESGDMVLDYFRGPKKHQIFYFNLQGEPAVPGDACWFSLYDFPEKVSCFVEEVSDFSKFIEKSIEPTI